MDNYHVVGDPELAPDVPSTSIDASEVSYNSETVEDALDRLDAEKVTLVDFSDLSKYGIATSGEKINATLQEICKKVPVYCEVKIMWTGNQTLSDSSYRFGTLGAQMPELYGSLYIHKTSSVHPCVIEFIPYNSINHYVRNYDYINSTDHLSNWTEIANTVPVSRGGTGQTTAKNAFNSLAYATGTSTYGPSDSNEFLVGYNNDFSRRPFSAIWNTIAGKIRSAFGFSDANVLPIANGGTGKTTASEAWTALGGGSVGKLNTNASTSQYLRGDGSWASPPNTTYSFSVQTYSKAVSVAASSTAGLDITIGLSGYLALGIVGFNVTGTGESWAMIFENMLTSATNVHLKIRNMWSGGAISPTIQVRVLYYKIG